MNLADSFHQPPAILRWRCVLLVLLLSLACGADDTRSHFDLDDNTVTVGRSHACGLERVDDLSIGGEIVCWGDAAHGALDPPAGLFVQLSAAEHTTCAISSGERVWCWGGDAAVVLPASAAARGVGEGGEASEAVRAFFASHPRAAAAAATLDSAALLQVSVGGRHACALLSGSGRVFCWGDDTHGQVSAAPAEAALAQVSCGGDACCGLLRGGEG